MRRGKICKFLFSFLRKVFSGYEFGPSRIIAVSVHFKAEIHLELAYGNLRGPF